MTGVSADLPDSAAQTAQQDLVAVMNGGENFLARMKALADLRTSTDKAISDLKLGEQAANIIATTDYRFKEAEKARQDAVDALAQANAQAQRIISEARRKASEVADEASRRAAEIKASADKAKADALREADETKRAAAGLHEEATRQKIELDAKIAAAKKAEDDHRTAEQEHNDAAEAAKSHAEIFKRRVEHLEVAIQSAAAIR